MADLNITELLAKAQDGDLDAENTLFQTIYADLWRRAHRFTRTDRQLDVAEAGEP